LQGYSQIRKEKPFNIKALWLNCEECDRDPGNKKQGKGKNIFWRVITKSKKCYIKDTPYVCLIVLPRQGNLAGIFLARNHSILSHPDGPLHARRHEQAAPIWVKLIRAPRRPCPARLAKRGIGRLWHL
jgi:hypothetical protein